MQTDISILWDSIKRRLGEFIIECMRKAQPQPTVGRWEGVNVNELLEKVTCFKDEGKWLGPNPSQWWRAGSVFDPSPIDEGLVYVCCQPTPWSSRNSIFIALVDEQNPENIKPVIYPQSLYESKCIGIPTFIRRSDNIIMGIWFDGHKATPRLIVAESKDGYIFRKRLVNVSQFLDQCKAYGIVGVNLPYFENENNVFLRGETEKNIKVAVHAHFSGESLTYINHFEVGMGPNISTIWLGGKRYIIYGSTFMSGCLMMTEKGRRIVAHCEPAWLTPFKTCVRFSPDGKMAYYTGSDVDERLYVGRMEYIGGLELLE